MTKSLQILAGALLLLVAAALLAIALLDPNAFKDDIRAWVRAATGREPILEGDLGLSLFPWLGLEIRGARLVNAPDLGDMPLAVLERAEVRVRLIPLLRRRLEVDRVRVEGLRIYLGRDAEGRANWDNPAGAATQAEGAAASAEAPPDSPSVPAGQSAPVTFAIGGMELVDLEVTWDDRRLGRHLTLAGLTLTTGPIVPGAPVELRLAGELTGPDTGLRAGLTAEGTLAADMGRRRFALAPFALHLADIATVGGLSGQLDLAARMDADLAARRYRIDGLELRVDASGEVLSGGRIEAVAEARAELDLGAGTLKVVDLSIRSDDLRIGGEATGEGLPAAPALKGTLAVAALDLRAWLRRKGLPVPRTADPETLRRLALETSWGLADRHLALHGLVLDLDQTRVTGSAERVATSPPAYRFALAADKLDLDRYLPPPRQARPIIEKTAEPPASEPRPEAKPAPAPAAGESATAAAPVPGVAAASRPFAMEPLRDLDLGGRLRIAELRVARLDFLDTSLEIRARDGGLDIDNQVQGFYQGRLEGRLGLDARGAEPRVALVQQAMGIQAGPLLRDLTGDEGVTGRGDFTADLTAVGWTEDVLRRSLAGKLSIHVAQGAVKGFNLERLVREAVARLTGNPTPVGLPPQTDFTDLSASAEVLGGVLTNRDLIVASDYLRVTGRGAVDLGNERFDYRFEPMFVKPPRGRGLKELEDIPIPVHLTGSFDRPQWQVAAGGALREVGQRQLEERLEGQGGDALKKLEERTGIKGLEKGLRGLFGR